MRLKGERLRKLYFYFSHSILSLFCPLRYDHNYFHGSISGSECKVEVLNENQH